MQLIGQAVRHQMFGKGVVTAREEGTLTVCFAGGEKKFLYPDAFEKHLVLKNQALQDKVAGILHAREEEERTRQRKWQEEQERSLALRSLKLSPNSQAVFALQPEEKERVFSRWSVSTGCYLSGSDKGRPRIPERMKPNSMCLLTVRAKEAPEEERRIAGAFMVGEEFVGSLCRDGVIQSHPQHRLYLEEAQRPLFWPYVVGDSAAQRWGKAAFKYFSSQAGQRILYDLAASLAGGEHGQQAEAFYQYFCQVNRLRRRSAAQGTAKPEER